MVNVGPGSIERIDSITFKPSGMSLIGDNNGIKYSTCETTCKSGEECELTPSAPGCVNKLDNKIIVGNGITLTTTIEAESVASAEVTRHEGTIAYNYCYDINVGQITVCKPGKC